MAIDTFDLTNLGDVDLDDKPQVATSSTNELEEWADGICSNSPREDWVVCDVDGHSGSQDGAH